MSYGDMRLRPFAACALTAAALLTYGATAQAQVRPGGIGGQSGSGGLGNSSTGSSSASFGGSGGTAFNGASAFGGANGPGGMGSLGGSSFGSAPSASGGAATMNPFGANSGNPLQPGIANGANAAFGTPLYGNPGTTSTNLLGTGGVGSLGTAGAPRGGTGAAISSRPAGLAIYGALGMLASARSEESFPRATSALSPSSSAAAPGPAVRLATPSPAMQAEFRDLVSRCDRIDPATKSGVQFGLDGSDVVLRGTAASEAEARQVGSLIRFAPGVRGVRNEMTWRAP